MPTSTPRHIHRGKSPKSGCRKRLRRGETAEERFHTLARGWLAYPVTPAAHATTAEERLQKYHRHIGIVAERRHFSVTRYAERILLISRAVGTPLLVAGRLTQLAKIFPVIYTTAFRR